MKLVDALNRDMVGWDELDACAESVKEFEVDGYIIQGESHTLEGYEGKAYAFQLFTKDRDPIAAYSWFEWKEVNSIKKLKEITGI